jgi:hypothetical protein
MQFDDDRTPEQQRTHHVLIGGTDSFLSGWGKAEGGQSYAFWACEPTVANRVERWVRNRGDMQRVRIVGTGYKPRGAGHCHVYVVTDAHPALR